VFHLIWCLFKHHSCVVILSVNGNGVLQEELEDTKGVIRIRKSKKDRQHNGQKRKDKQLSTIHTHKTEYRKKILIMSLSSFRNSVMQVSVSLGMSKILKTTTSFLFEKYSY